MTCCIDYRKRAYSHAQLRYCRDCTGPRHVSHRSTVSAMLQFDFIQEQELDQVAAFLRRIFRVPATFRTFQPDVLRWKYFAPHPLWEGSRSCVFRKDGEIVAHGCVTPFRWLTAAGPLRASCVIDWAADRSVPGAGLLLFRKIAERFDGLAGIGGSAGNPARPARARCFSAPGS